jgi:hypothetical protein
MKKKPVSAQMKKKSSTQKTKKTTKMSGGKGKLPPALQAKIDEKKAKAAKKKGQKMSITAKKPKTVKHKKKGRV